MGRRGRASGSLDAGGPVLAGDSEMAVGEVLGRQNGLVGDGGEAEVEVTGDVGAEVTGTVGAKSGEIDGAVTEEDVDLCGRIARAYGIEIRDRAGTKFQAANFKKQMWRRAETEYKYRVANVLVYGLPVVALHYVGDLLWMKMFYPWLTGLLLVGLGVVWRGLAVVVECG